METYVKRATFKVALDATNGKGAGEFEAILSSPSVDRDGEVIDPKAFDPLPDALPIHRDHDMTTRGLCAVAAPYYDGDLLKAKGEFLEDADGQRMRMYAQKGILRLSVGFMSPKVEVRSGVPHIVKGELLEASFVTVPSNRDAVVTGVKGYALERAGTKAVAGSFEALRDELQGALRAAGVGGYVLATFPDSVVYEAYDSTEGRRRTYQATYTLGEDGLTLGTPEVITIAEVIQPRKSPSKPPAAKAPELDEAVSPDYWAKAIESLSITTQNGVTR